MKETVKTLAAVCTALVLSLPVSVNTHWFSTASAQQKQEQTASAWNSYDDGAMAIQWKVEENTAKDKIVSLVFKSKSTERFSLGWVDNPQFILTTDEGDFVTKEMKPRLTAGNRKFDLTPFKLRLTFRQAKGVAQSLRITDIRPLDENGLPTSGIIDLTIELAN